MRALMIATVVLAVSACTTVPEQLQGEYPDISPGRAENSVVGANVRWGGVILKAHNRDDRTCFEVLSRELDKYLRPVREDYSNGRFLACKQGFQDPLVFAKGREITAIGTIRNLRLRKVDEFNYRYPVLDVDTLVLWEKRRNVVVYRGYHHPWHYHPWPYSYWGYRPFGPTYGYSERRSLLPDPSIIRENEESSTIFDEPRGDLQ